MTSRQYWDIQIKIDSHTNVYAGHPMGDTPNAIKTKNNGNNSHNKKRPKNFL